VGGIVIIAKRKYISETIIKERNKDFGTNYGEDVIRRGYIALIVIGLAALYFGISGIIDSVKHISH
jgi:hypothetical protein